MRTTRILIVVFFIMASFQALAQIEKEIISYIDSSEYIVENGRKFLMNRLSASDHEKAKEIYQYLEDYSASKKYAAFSYTEGLYVNLLTGNWQALTAYMKDYKHIHHQVPEPKNEDMTLWLNRKIALSSDSLWAICSQSDLDQESKDLIQIMLHLMDKDIPDDSYFSMLNSYEKRYKKSSYHDFITSFLPSANSKGSISLSMGSGTIFPTEQLGDYFSSNASFNISIDLNFNKIFTSLYVQSCTLKVEKPFATISEFDLRDFSLNEPFYYSDAGIKIGYFLIRSNRFHLAPAITFAGAKLKSTRYDDAYNEEDKEFVVLNSFVLGPALHTEIKLFGYKPKRYNNSQNKYVSIKLEGGYNYITKTNYPVFKGNTPFVSMALAWGTGYF